VRNCAGTTLSLGVWSSKVRRLCGIVVGRVDMHSQGQKIREIHATISTDSPSIGVSLQWGGLANNEMWHVLDVTANSPAENAGILPYGDYVIGSPQGVMKGEAGLSELVEQVCVLKTSLYCV